MKTFIITYFSGKEVRVVMKSMEAANGLAEYLSAGRSYSVVEA